MCRTLESDSYNRRYHARAKTATFESEKGQKKRGWNLPQFDKENEFFCEKVFRVYRSPTSRGCGRSKIVSIGLPLDKVKGYERTLRQCPDLDPGRPGQKIFHGE